MDCSGMSQFDGNGKPSKGGRKVKGKKGKGRTSFTRLSHCRLFRFKRPRKSPSHGGNQNKGEVESPSHGNQNKGLVELPYPRAVTYEDKCFMWKSRLNHNHDLCIASRKKKPIYTLYYVEEFSGSEIEEEGLEHLYNLSD